MECPKCNHKTRCYDSREGGKLRRRQCLSKECQHRFATTEVIVSEIEPLKPGRKKADYVSRTPGVKTPTRASTRKPPADEREQVKAAFLSRDSISVCTTPTTEAVEKPIQAFSFALKMPPGAAARLGR